MQQEQEAAEYAKQTVRGRHCPTSGQKNVLETIVLDSPWPARQLLSNIRMSSIYGILKQDKPTKATSVAHSTLRC